MVEKEQKEEQEEKVVDIRSRQPHMQGQAKCLNCEHEWMAVAEVGTVGLDCPECECSRGVWRGISVPWSCEDDGYKEIFLCDCGSLHFFLTRAAIHCCACGTAVVFEDLDFTG